jgi:hypothetical protein
MTTAFLPMPTYVRSNPPKVDRQRGDHEVHPETTALGRGGVHQARSRR